ncbi:hypothetical protein jhhlp_008238 [Lomentospora prolificans]|uniref:Major facilitator superfamily (MFS) profile domain-containing protein n=1 Tax=Lomentospora prolificans TaxID=41688 RepID=A0A2N3MXH3_9PEZI|nr:hypothetical protein jhhlp_008238 [Lomentospora prolificans]
MLGTINAIYEIGCFVGAINVVLVGERLGRRKCRFISAILIAVGAVVQATAAHMPQMIVGRIGNGFNTATTPLWMSELSLAKSRGRIVTAEGSCIAFFIVATS